MDRVDGLIFLLAAVAILGLLTLWRHYRVRRDGSHRVSACLKFAMKTGRLEPRRVLSFE